MTEASTAWQLLRRRETRDCEHERKRTQRAAGLQKNKGRSIFNSCETLHWDLHLARPLPDLAVVADPGEVEVGYELGLVREGQEALRVD